jgi:hypothetical protein
MKLIAHDQKDDMVTHRYSIQTEDGKVWLLFDLPNGSPFYPMDIANAMEDRLQKMPLTPLQSAALARRRQ